MTSREKFDQAIPVILEHEGGFSDHPDDHGGATNYGISSRAFPDVDVVNLTRDDAIELYWTEIWTPGHYDLLPVEIAVKTFDLGVNMGRHQAVCCLQRALRSCGSSVTVDGLIGPETAGVCNWTCHFTVLAALRSEAAGQYRVILARDPAQLPFTVGWLNRAYS